MSNNPNDPLIRIMNRAYEHLYVTGFDGADVLTMKITDPPTQVPYSPEANGNFAQPGQFHFKSDLRMAFIYLGTSPRTESREFTCFMQHGPTEKTWIIGFYQGPGVRPTPLDEQYGSAGDFVDDGERYIVQYNLNKQTP